MAIQKNHRYEKYKHLWIFYHSTDNNLVIAPNKIIVIIIIKPLNLQILSLSLNSSNKDRTFGAPG